MKITEDLLLFYGSSEWPSNWNRRGFYVKEIFFPHGEAYMMYCKAMFFQDPVTAQKILNEPDPYKCKQLGLEVSPYVDEAWAANRIRFVRRGLLEKARHHEDVTNALIDSGERLIVEASRSDRIWGIGLNENDPRALDPKQWLGANGLGEGWMWARDRRKEDLAKGPWEYPPRR